MSASQLNNPNVEPKEKQVDEKKEIADPNGNFKSGKHAGKGRLSRRGRNVNDDRRLAWEAEQAKKLVIEKDVKGKVKWYSVRYHYGFIARDDEKENDVFVHQTAIAKSRIVKYYLRTLGDGEEVIFDIVQGKQGPEAANVTGPNGTEVRGSRFHNRQFYTYRRRFGYNRERHSQERGYGTPPEIGVEPGMRRRSAQSEHKIPIENVGKEIDDVKKGNAERKRHVRNFRARRPPMKKGIEGKEVEGGAGDGNKENLLSELENEAHTEGRGDGCFHNEKPDQFRFSAAKINLGKFVDARGATEVTDTKAIEKLSTTDNN